MRALYAETEGSPLFLQELVRHLADAGVGADQRGHRASWPAPACPRACGG